MRFENITRRWLGPVRISLLVILFFFVLPVVMAIGRPETGPFEKVVLAAATIGLLSLALPIHRVGRRTP